MILISTAGAEALHINKNLLDISDEEFANLATINITKFMHAYSNDYNLEIEYIQKDFPKFLEMYNTKLKDLNLKKYEHIKEK